MVSSLYRQKSAPLPTNRLLLLRTSLLKPSLPSRTRGCSTNCVSARPTSQRHWNSRRLRQRCSNHQRVPERTRTSLPYHVEERDAHLRRRVGFLAAAMAMLTTRCAASHAPLGFLSSASNGADPQAPASPERRRVNKLVHIADLRTDQSYMDTKPQTPIAKFGALRTLLNAPLLRKRRSDRSDRHKFAPLRRSRSNCSRTSPRKP